MGILERIKDIEHEVARTQINKATEHHVGRLKAQLAKLRSQLIDANKGPTVKGQGFDVQKFGDGRVVLIGFPSVGKSTLLSKLTKTESKVAAYEFTTLTCVPGVIEYRDARIQLLDLPGIIEGAAEGRGRGRQVVAVARSADLVLMILDATKDDSQRRKLEREMESVGIRLNQRPPDIVLKIKKGGGVSFNSTCKVTHVDERLAHAVLQEYKIHNADVLFRGDYTVDQFIDVIEGNRNYIKCIYAYNKVDMLSLTEIDSLARQPMSVVISSSKSWNLDILLERLWDELKLVRIYTKKSGSMPDWADPLILTPQRGGASVQNAVRLIHAGLLKEMRCALVWGRSAKHTPQQVGLGE